MSALANDIEALAGISADGPGVNRFAWTPELMLAYDWMRGRLAERGLDVEVDPAGNLLGRWSVGNGPALVIGSHLDTVPSGGRFDGALGVLAGLQAIRLLQERGFTPKRPIWLIAFMDEEGARFGTAVFGSRAFVGDDLSSYVERTDAAGITLGKAMAEAGFDVGELPGACRISEVGTYLELHIEQGPVLEQRGSDIGIVTGIVGLVGLHATYRGAASHAGTTPLTMRRDALAGASRAVLAVRDRARKMVTAVATVGRISVDPNGTNVVPGRVDFTIDLRSADAALLNELTIWTRRELAAIAAAESLELDVEEMYRVDALALDPTLISTLEQAAASENAAAFHMPSGAGHDAMVVGAHVPAGMLFVPSADGVSHNPAEFTATDHCELGARVLARAVEALAS